MRDEEDEDEQAKEVDKKWLERKEESRTKSFPASPQKVFQKAESAD